MIYQQIILITAIFLTIFIIFLIYISFLNQKKNETWPPVIAECPDYWSLDATGKCMNIHNLGICPNKTVDFNQPPFGGSDDLCAKYNWATTCRNSWDGITYGTSTNPCDDSSN